MLSFQLYFQEDLVSLGRIVLALSCNSFIAIQRENLQQSMELVTTNYRYLKLKFKSILYIFLFQIFVKYIYVSVMICGT